MDIANKLITFFKEVLTQMKKVNWLSRRKTIKYTLIVIVVSILVATFLSTLDYVFTLLLDKFVI